MLLACLYPGDFCGEMCLFPRRDSRSAMIRASTECSLLEIPYEPSIELTSKHPSLWMALTGQLAERRADVGMRFVAYQDDACREPMNRTGLALNALSIAVLRRLSSGSGPRNLQW